MAFSWSTIRKQPCLSPWHKLYSSGCFWIASASSSARSMILRISHLLDFRNNAICTATGSLKTSFSAHPRNALTVSRHLKENVSRDTSCVMDEGILRLCRLLMADSNSTQWLSDGLSSTPLCPWIYGYKMALSDANLAQSFPVLVTRGGITCLIPRSARYFGTETEASKNVPLLNLRNDPFGFLL